ncbi:MAG: triose-phosphate isomerase [Planctomycetota bacterium]
MRRPYLAGNWKMNLDRRSARELAGLIREHVGDRTDVEVAVLPPFVYLAEIARSLAGSPVRVGAQNMCDEPAGAFTGEVSAAMLVDVGCDLVVLGHSERRHIYGETDELVNAKVHAALASDLDVILCVGETIEEREKGSTEEVVRTQLTQGLAGVAPSLMTRVTLAYEPVWAIGTGRTATPAQAGEVHQYLRGLLHGLYDEKVAEATRIQYGGSVKPDNIARLMAEPDVDGALVGGASLKPELFLPIIDFDRK